MAKSFPEFRSDQEAEAFVAEADLSAYSLADMIPMRFELRPKDKSVSLRLPEALLDEVRRQAKGVGMPTQRFMRLAIERALRESKGG